MSRVERKTHKLKLMAKKETPWREITVTGEIRNSAPHMKNVSRIFANSKYECDIFECGSSIGGVTQLVVARLGHLEPILFHELLKVKNELFGVNALAVEVYPREIVGSEFKIRILWILPEGHDLPYGLDKPTAWGGK